VFIGGFVEIAEEERSWELEKGSFMLYKLKRRDG
jgi:hypothetical protein